MTRGTFPSWMVPAVLTLALAACAKPPTREMAEADGAMRAAVEAGAEMYAGEELALAQEVLADAKAKLESKDYTGARNAAVEAKAQAEAARDAVGPNKETARSAARERIDALGPRAETAAAAAQKLRGRDAASARTLASELADGLAAARSEFEAGNFNLALGHLDDAETRLGELELALDAAASAPPRRR